MPRDLENRMRGRSMQGMVVGQTRTARTSLGRLRGLLAGAVFLGLGMTQTQAKSVNDLLAFQSPPTLAGSYLAARFAGSQHDVGAAADYFRTALAMDPGNLVLADRTFQLLVADGRFAEAIPLAEALARQNKSHALARLVLGVEALKGGHWTRARSQLAQIQMRPLSDLTVAILTGWADAGRGDVDGALKTIDKVGGLDWYAVFKNYHAGLIADLAGRKALASKRLADAYGSDNRALRIVEAEVRNLARDGKKAEALAALGEFEKQVADHPVIMALRAEIEAGKKPTQVVSTPQGGAAEFLYGLGSALGRDGGEDIAAMYLQLAIWLDPNAELPMISLAGLQGQMKQYDKAIALLGRIPATSKMRPLADIQIGRYETLLQNYPEASKHLQAVIQRTPKDLDAIVALGDVLRADKKFEEAAKVYSQAIDLIAKPSKNDWTFFYYRGIAYERTKQWPKAEADFYKALELMPDEPHVLNYLGYSWIDMGMNLDKGLELVKKAVELKSDDGYIVDSLAWAYFKLGRYDEAVAELEKAILLKPDDPVINDHLGDAYWKVDRKLEATFQWKHALVMKPEADEIPKIEKKLAKGLDDGPKTPTAAGDPVKPALSGEPARPEIAPEQPKPASSDAPSKPAGTDAPTPAVEPTKPTAPEAPAKPVVPEESVVPVPSDTQTKPAGTDEPAKPAGTESPAKAP